MKRASKLAFLKPFYLFSRFSNLLLLIFAGAISSHSVAKEAPKELDPRDDGSQIKQAFRVNYAGYIPLQEKIAVYLTDEKKPVDWVLKNSSGKTILSGTSKSRRKHDFASGDTFYLIDFSAAKTEGKDYYLQVGEDKSAPFDISTDPYGSLKYDFFDYFRDHERRGDIFNRGVNNWIKTSVPMNFVADAGDQGYYPTNAAEAQWSLINLLESYPEINEYYSNAVKEMKTVFDQLDFMTEAMTKAIVPGEKLASAKFATFSNDDWAPCPGADGIKGPCVSKPETKATYAVARTLASMARLNLKHADKEKAKDLYKQAEIAFSNAVSEPLTCIGPNDVGGEGGYYPNNDNWSLWRDPRTHRDPCASGPIADPKDNNVNDDQYAAIVELFLTSKALKKKRATKKYKSKMLKHSHHQRVDLFFFGAVSTEGTLSLLTHRPKGIDLTIAENNLFHYADDILEFQQVGYPGVTFNVNTRNWRSFDNDEVNADFRWASNRMQLNDARILMFAAELSYKHKNFDKAAAYTNGVLKVLDQISGTNAVALAMYTTGDAPNIEYAITRTHDLLIPDTEPGKLALGPNNWTNSNDPDMPEFGSQPGMKMFALTGTGWASREIAIDGNASLIPVVYFATEQAPRILKAALK